MNIANPTRLTVAAAPPPGPPPTPPSRDLNADVARVISILRRRLLLIVLIAASVFALAVIVTLQMKPEYTATSSVLINTSRPDGVNISAAIAGEISIDSSIIDTEIEVMQSRALAERVADALKLDDDPEFAAKAGGRGRLAAMLKSPLAALGMGKAQSAPAPDPADPTRSPAHEAVVDNLLSGLSVRRAGMTYVIDIGYQSKDPQKAALIANTFADKYLVERLDDKYEAAQQTTQWLNQRLAQLQPQVEQAEAAVQQYKAQHGLLASVGSSLTQQEISSLNNQLDQARADASEKDARLSTAQQATQSGANGENLTGPLSSSTVLGSLRSQEAEASNKVSDLQTKYGPKHPEVERAQRALADIEKQISAEVARDVGSLQAEDQIAHQRVASLEASLGAAKGALIGDNAASVQLDDLQRRADAASTLYQSLLNRAKQSSINDGGEQSDGRVVSHARVPLKASSPKFAVNLALGLVLGLVAGVGSAFLLELLDSRLGTSEDVERSFGLRHLGSIPRLQSTMTRSVKRLGPPGDYVAKNPLSMFAESFRNLRASILYSQGGAPVRVIAITSALPNEGKSTTAVGLGRSMALSGSKIVIVDCDLRRASISHVIGVAGCSAGLAEVLQGEVKLEDALLRDEASGAWFLPISNSAAMPKDILGSPAMDRLLQELRQKFDVVILDTPPVIAVSDTRLIATKCDAVVFLVQWRKTPKKAVQTALSLLTSVGANIAGIALTLVDVRSQAKYGYGDVGAYYHQVRKYYAE